MVSLRCVLVTMEKVLIPLWFDHEDSHLVDGDGGKNSKSSQILCFKLLKDGNLLCEALVQN